MKLREFIGVFEQSERLRIVKDGKEIYTGYKALMEHAELEAVMDAEVKRFCPVPEIRHKEWKERGLMPPMKPPAAKAMSSRIRRITVLCSSKFIWFPPGGAGCGAAALRPRRCRS